MAKVPIVTTEPQLAPEAPSGSRDLRRVKAANTMRLLQKLEATASLPAATRLNIQMQTLADPEAFSADEWMGTDGAEG